MRSSCDLKFSGLSSNPWEVSGTVFLPLNRCKSTAFFEFRGGSMFSIFFFLFRVRSHARVRAHGRGGWTGV